MECSGSDDTSTTYSGIISGTGVARLVKIGNGALTLGVANTHPLTIVQAGSVFVTGIASTMAASLTGGTLGGTGRTAALTATGGRLAPGLSLSPGILSTTGNLSVNASTTLSVDLNGTTVGTGHDQVDVTGTVTLGGAVLNVTLGFVPPPFTTFVIVNNDAADVVSGTFAGLPQGARLTAGGTGFSISYTGGTGNDVVLTSLPPPPNATADAASTPFGATVVLSPAANDTPGAGATLVPGSIDLDPTTPGQQTMRVVAGQATFTLNVGTGQVSVVPDAAFHGISAIGYTITDNLGQVSNVAPMTVTVLPPSADLSLTQTGPSTATPGTTITYTIVVSNAGPSDASTVVVADTPPPGLIFVSTAGDCSTPFPCTLGTLQPGATRSISATFSVPASYTAPNVIVHTVNVSSTITTDSVSGNDSASVSTTATPRADLSIEGSGLARAQPGSEVLYSLVIRNHGPSDAANVTVVAAMPPGLIFVRTTGDCTTPLPCALGTLPVGQTRAIAMRLAIPRDYSAPDPIVTSATASAATVDPSSSNDHVTLSTTLARADLSITATGPAAVLPGHSLVYTLAVTNNGPHEAVDVVLDDPTPLGLTFTSAAGACVTPLPCALGTLLQGETRTIVATFTMPSTYTSPAAIVNAVAVSAVTPDPVAANNHATVSSALASPTDADGDGLQIVVKTGSG